MNCFVLIENYLNGCHAGSRVVGVTTDQQFSYNWLRSESEEFLSRMIQEVPFYPPLS